VSDAPVPDQPPVASINAPDQAEVGETVTFDASGSSWTNDITSFAWNFGDGSTADAIQIDKVYNAAGVYNVTLTLTDNKGLQGATNKQITIVQPAATATPPPAATDTATPPPAATDTPQPGNPPTANMSITPNPQDVGQTVTFDGSASTGDGAAITGYDWDFGDGQVASGVSVNHVYNAAGQYNVQLTVTDENGQQGVALDVVTINDIVAPTPTTDPQVDELESQMWILANTISDTLITAEFQGGQLSGSGGCNTYTGSYDVSGGNGSINITIGGQSNMLCSDTIDAQETQFLTALQAASGFQVQNNQLRLTGPTTLDFTGSLR
jgi:PKD repeat protein